MDTNNQEKQQKILIIEDDKFMSELLTMRLKKDGLAFDLAQDAEEGLAKINEEKPILILLDLVLPGMMDGYKFLEKIKSDKETASIPVIILSNLGQKEEIKRGKELGAKDYLVKANYNLSEITKKIEQALKEE